MVPHPFDDTQWPIHGLTVESAADAVSVSGDAVFRHDRTSLDAAHALATYFTALAAALERAHQQEPLPAHATIEPPTPEPNPFE